MTAPGYRYACCPHCEYTGDDEHDNGHAEPCPDGCNDGEGGAA